MQKETKIKHRGKKYIEILANLIEISAGLHHPLLSIKTLSKASQAAINISGMEHAIISIYNPELEAFMAAPGLEDNHALYQYSAKELKGWLQNLSSGKEIIIKDTLSACIPEKIKALTGKLNARSIVIVPITANDKLVGTIFAYSASEKTAISDITVSAMSVLARQISIVIDNCALNNKLKGIGDNNQELDVGDKKGEDLDRFIILDEISNIAINNLNLAEMAEAIISILKPVLGTSLISIRITDPATHDLRLAAQYGWPPEYATLYSALPIAGEFEESRLYRTGGHIVIGDIGSHTGAEGLAELIKLLGVQVNSLISMRLEANGRGIGTVTLGWNKIRLFTRRDIDSCKAICDRIAVSLYNTLCYINESKARKLAEATEAIYKAALSKKDIYQLSHELIKLIVDANNADFGEITLMHSSEKSPEILSFYEIKGGSSRYFNRKAGNGFAKAIAKSRKTICIQDTRNSHIAYDALPDQTGARSMLGTLFELSDASVGIICIYSREPDRFTYNQREFLEAIAGKVSAVIENAYRDSLDEQVGDSKATTKSNIDDVLHSIIDPFFILDNEWRFAHINYRLEELVQKSKEDLLGRNVREIFPEATNDNFYKHCQIAAAGKKPVVYGEFYPSLNKEFCVNVNPFQNGFSVHMRDITERRQVEKLSNVLNKINTAINSTIDFNEIMQEVILESTEALGVESTIAILREDANWVIKYAHGNHENLVGQKLTEEASRLAGLVTEKGKPFISTDAYNDNRLNRELMEKYNIRSFMAIPLKIKDDIVGILAFNHHSTTSRFSYVQVDFTYKLAISVSLALENLQLYSSIRYELSRTRLLQDIAMAATTNQDLGVVANGILKALNEHLRLKAGNIYVFDKKESALVKVASLGYSDAETGAIEEQIPDKSHTLLVEAIKKRKMLTHCDDVIARAWVRIKEEAGSESSRYLAAPIDYRRDTVGAYHLVFDGEEDFSKTELDMFQSVGQVIGQAIENARLLEAEIKAQKRAQDELEISNILLRAVDTLTLSTDLKQVVECLADIVIDITGRSRVIIGLTGNKTDEFEVLASRGMSKPSSESRINSSRIPVQFRQLTNRKKSAIIDFETADLPGQIKDWHGLAHARLGMISALTVGNQEIGCIIIDEPGQRPSFTAKEKKLIEGISTQAAVIIQNAKLHYRSLARASTFEAISQMGNSISSTLKISEALSHIVDYSMLLFNASASLVLTLNKERAFFRVAASEGAPIKQSKGVLTLAEAEKLELDSIVPTYISNLRTIPESPFFAAAAESGFVSAFISPILIENTLRGLLVIQDKSDLSPSNEDIVILRLFTNQAATAIKNAKRFEYKRCIADTLQEALLTMPDNIAGIRFGHIYRSATETAKVGGDFYELFELNNEQIGIIMGDVSGKGLIAATLTALVKNTIKAFAHENISPAAVMEKTNNIVRKASTDSSFVTVFFGILNKKTGDLTYCNSGHPPAILKRADGNMELLTVSSSAIGAFESLGSIDDSVALKAGDTLILYTDGITESRCRGSFFGESGLMDCIQSNSVIPADKISQVIFDEVMNYTDGTRSDDIALLSMSLEG